MGLCGAGKRGGSNALSSISSKKYSKIAHSVNLFMNLPLTSTHTSSGTRCDGLNEAKDVDIDGSIRTLLLIRHHLLTYVCNTDS